jgi:ABC-type sugar transport system permease subunit/peptidoglycan/LPS O-acetylase OafA/YrhL
MNPLRPSRWLTPRRAVWFFLAPALVINVCFGLLPVIFTAAISLTRWDALQGFNAIEFSGLENFSWVLIDDDWFGGALGRSLWLAIVSTTLVHLVAIPLAVLLNQQLRRWRGLLSGIYFLPWLTSGIAVGFILMALFGTSEVGLLNAGLLGLARFEIAGVHPLAWFFPTEPINWWREHGAAIGVFAHIWHGLGWNVLLYIAALQYIPEDLYEAARLDGANAWQTLRYVTIPQLRPMIFFAATLSLVGAIQSGGPRDVQGYMFHMAYQGEGDFGAAAAMGIIVFAVLAVLIFLLWSTIGGRPRVPGCSTDERPPSRIERWLRAAMRMLRDRLRAEPDNSPDALRGFAGMRAIACMMVIAHHMAQRIDAHWSLPWFLQPVWSFAMRCDMGVSLFFVLSGALLSMPFWRRFLANAAPPSLTDYAARRAARIVPGYWTALTVCTLVGLWAMPDGVSVLPRYLAGMSFTSALHYVSFFPSELDPVLWSISLEVICYFLLPLALLPAWRLLPDRDPRRALRYLAWVIVGLQVLHFIVIGAFMTDENGKGWVYGQIGGAKEWLPYWNPASFMSQFLLGSLAALAIAWQSQPGVRRDHDYDAIALRTLAAAAAVLFFFGEMGQPNAFTRQPYVTPIFPALCAFALFAIHFSTRVHRWFDNRLFKHIATLSFGLYLWHWPVMELLRIYVEPKFVFGELRNVGEWLLLGATVIVVAMVLATLSWRLLEKPVLDAVRGRLSRTRASARVAQAQA